MPTPPQNGMIVAPSLNHGAHGLYHCKVRLQNDDVQYDEVLDDDVLEDNTLNNNFWDYVFWDDRVQYDDTWATMMSSMV